MVVMLVVFMVVMDVVVETHMVSIVVQSLIEWDSYKPCEVHGSVGRFICQTSLWFRSEVYLSQGTYIGYICQIDGEGGMLMVLISCGCLLGY